MELNMKDTPQARHRKTIGLSTAVSILSICVVIIPIVGWLFRDKAISFISAAVADEIKGEVQQQLKPTNDAFKILIQNTIAELEDEIARLQYRKENEPDTWTVLDAQDLTTKQRRLTAQRKALAAIEQAMNGSN